MTARLRRAGVGLVLLYAAVAVLTYAAASRAIRPLFDGFAPPAPYRWVKPPPELARDNQPPQAVDRTVPIGNQGSEPTVASTPDAQIIVTLPQGAIGGHPPDTAVILGITPADAGTLGPLPAGLRVVGNAYRVSLVYQPSLTPVTQVGAPATIALTAASQGDVLLYSPDGRAWQTSAARPFGATHGLIGPMAAPGYYLVTASRSVTTIAPSGRGGGNGSAVTVVVLAVVVVGVGAVAVVVALRSRSRSRSRRRRPRP